MKSTCNLAQKGVSFLIEIYTSEGNTSEGNTSEGNTSEGNTSEGNTSEGKGTVYTRRRTAKSTLLREKTKEGFYVEREKMVSNAVGGCDGLYDYSDNGICCGKR